MNTFKTPKGTTLPLLDLKGKAYLQVAHRLVWFREEHPDWSITTTMSHTEKMAISRAEIRDEKGYTVATAHKRETVEGFYDFVEKAETGAIGRALALCGYGTQFTDDLEEGERLADAPLSRAPTAASKTSPQIPSAVVGTPWENEGTSRKWDHQAPKEFNMSNYAKVMGACEKRNWKKQDAADLSQAKFGNSYFKEMSKSDIDWLVNEINTSTFLQSLTKVRASVKEIITSNPPSSLFEADDPGMTEEDIPF